MELGTVQEMGNLRKESILEMISVILVALMLFYTDFPNGLG